MMSIEVIENYLTNESFDDLLEVIDNQPWVLQKKMNPNSVNDHQFQFIQDYGSDPIKNNNPDLFKRVSHKLLFPHLQNKEFDVRIFRCRANLFINTQQESFGGGFHKDIKNSKAGYYSLLLYLEDSNGATEFKNSGEKIYSKKNKAIIFPCDLEHQTIFQTDTIFRTNMNVNFQLVDRTK